MKLLLLAALLGILTFCADTSGGTHLSKERPRNSDDASAESSGDDEPQDENIGAAMLKMYKAYQAIMPCGLPDINIPPLAPFKLDIYKYNVDAEAVKIKGDYANIVVSGLNNFEILNLHTDTKTGRTSFDFNWSELQTLAEYKMDFWALMAGLPIESKGDGIINTKLEDFRIIGDFVLRPNGNGSVMSDFHLNFYFGDVRIDNWNKLWDIAGNNFVNKFSRDALVYFAKQIQGEPVHHFIHSFYLPWINESLEHISISDLVKNFNEGTEYLETHKCTQK